MIGVEVDVLLLSCKIADASYEKHRALNPNIRYH